MSLDAQKTYLLPYMLTVYFEQVHSALEYVQFPFEFLKESLLPLIPLNMRLRPVIVFSADACSTLS